jgi:hypothetical protein
LTRIALLAVTAFTAMAGTLSTARSEPAPPPACVYKSETYGEGAYLYPNRLLLLTCAVDAGRPLWKVVPTSKLNDLREQGSNLAIATSPGPVDTQISSPPKSPESGVQPKCFAVNGKRYCQ